MWHYELIQCRGTTRNSSMGVLMASENIINKLVVWVTLWADTMQGHNQEYIHGVLMASEDIISKLVVCVILWTDTMQGHNQEYIHGVLMASEDIINKLVVWVTLWTDTMQGQNQEYIYGGTNGIWGYYKQTSGVGDIMNWCNAGAQPGVHTWGY